MKPPIRVSLWLMPPLGVRETLYAQITDLSRRYQGSGSAPFEPHITILAGLECESQEHAEEWGRTLSQGLSSLGKIPCRFHKNIVSMVDDEGNHIWNQASVAVMRSTVEYEKLVEMSGQLLGVDTSDRNFLLPLGEPHLSFYYGTKQVPPCHEVTPPPDFDAHELALYSTSPGTVDGVQDWKLLALISLIE